MSTQESVETRSEPVSGLVIVGYILAALMPGIGFILGIVVATRPDKAIAKHGVWIIVVSVVAFIVWLAIWMAALSAGSATTYSTY